MWIDRVGEHRQLGRHHDGHRYLLVLHQATEVCEVELSSRLRGRDDATSSREGPEDLFHDPRREACRTLAHHHVVRREPISPRLPAQPVGSSRVRDDHALRSSGRPCCVKHECRIAGPGLTSQDVLNVPGRPIVFGLIVGSDAAGWEAGRGVLAMATVGAASSRIVASRLSGSPGSRQMQVDPHRNAARMAAGS